MAAAAPRKRKAPAPPAGAVSETLVLATALDAYAKAADALLKRADELNSTRQSLLENAAREIADLTRRREEEVAQYETQKRAGRIEVDQNLNEYGLEAARRLLDGVGMVAVPSAEYEALRADLQALRERGDADLGAAVAAATKTLETAHAHERRTQELTHAATVAELTAETKQLRGTIADLRHALENSEANLERQRQLTQSVAEACKAPSVVQNLGK